MSDLSKDGSDASRTMRLQCVDVLRAIAALAILLLHIYNRGMADGNIYRTLLFWPVEFGVFGITLFLVISGFCIHLAVARRVSGAGAVKTDWARFWRRRFFRLYPPYLAAIVVSLGIVFVVQAIGRERVLPHDTHHGAAFGWDLLTHLLLIQNLFKEYCFTLGNGPFWTLGLEEQLYALYALYLVLRFRWNVRHAFLTVLIVSASWNFVVPLGQAIWSILGGEPVTRQTFGLGPWAPAPTRWPIGFWFSWVLGAVAAEACAGAICLPRWCSRGSVGLAFLLLGVITNLAFLNRFIGPRCLRCSPELFETLKLVIFWVDCWSSSFFSVGCFILLNRWIAQERRGQFQGWWVRPLAAVGMISYSLYLTHEPLLNLGEALLGLDRSIASAGVRFAVYLPTCLAFAVLFFWAVERHFLHRPSRKGSVEPSTASAVSVASVGVVKMLPDEVGSRSSRIDEAARSKRQVTESAGQ